MHEFYPPPKYSSDWWRKRTVLNSLVGCGEEKHVPLSPDTWIVGAVYQSEFSAPFGGYIVLFPTITDALLWFRWVVLADESGAEDIIAEEAVLTEETLETAKMIDNKPKGSPSLEILTEALKHITLNRLDVYGIESIHLFFLGHASVEGWRLLFDDPTIRFEDGILKFSPAQWEEINEIWKNNTEYWSAGDFHELLFYTFLDRRNAIQIDMLSSSIGLSIQKLEEAFEKGELNGARLEPDDFTYYEELEPPLDLFIFRDKKYELFCKVRGISA